MDTKAIIEKGEAILGIELGSTRIKAVLIDDRNQVIAQGGHDWENKLEHGIWTYALSAVHAGLQDAYRNLAENVQAQYGIPLCRLKAMGISAMMHGYLVFDREGAQLAPFRTWRNTITEKAAKVLCELFDYPVPERWAISHLYQAILNGEEHVARVAHMTTLSGYVHYLLTGKRVLGIGDASGMFPINIERKAFDCDMEAAFMNLVKDGHFAWSLHDILPEVLCAGQDAGVLTPSGALFLDPSGNLVPGVPLCPPEGDAGTGMVATNSVRQRTGNVSAGTSVFAMVVLEKGLSKSYPGYIDLVTTPDGSLVAMSHANNCTGDYDKWIHLFAEALEAFGYAVPKGRLYDVLLSAALKGDKDCGGLLHYNYLSGETMTEIYEGRPLFMRRADAHFTLANFMRSQLFTALGALRCGMDVLFEREHVRIDRLMGHGGYFKTANVGQTCMAAAMHTPITVMSTAGEGGAWGIALLASYLVHQNGRALATFLDEDVFKDSDAVTLFPSPEDVAGFDRFYQAYKDGLPVEKSAVSYF